MNTEHACRMIDGTSRQPIMHDFCSLSRADNCLALGEALLATPGPAISKLLHPKLNPYALNLGLAAHPT